MNRYVVEPEQENERIDSLLPILFSEVSRSHCQRLIKQGEVLVNGEPVKPSYRCIVDDIITFEEIEAKPIPVLAEDIPLDILYEDDDVLVVNKPKGMVVHPAPGHYSGTLVNAVLYHCKDSLSGINGELRPGIVHRIDKDTTGALLVCKNDMSHMDLAEQIAAHSVTRKYVGIVCGEKLSETGTVDAPIGRAKNDRKKMAINEKNGKSAVTHYRVLAVNHGYSYVEFRLETGRTHQIRVHMASLGHPLLGDNVYGSKKCPFSLEGQCLHAELIGFIHPRTKEYMEYVAPMPEYFSKLLARLFSDSI